MSYLGMDPEVLRGVAGRLQAQASALESLEAQIQGSVDSAMHEWEGDDCYAFSDWWYSQHKPALGASSQAIGELATRLLKNVAEQERGSGAGAAGGHGSSHLSARPGSRFLPDVNVPNVPLLDGASGLSDAYQIINGEFTSVGGRGVGAVLGGASLGLSGAELVDSFGDGEYDRSIMAAVSGAAVFTPPPVSLSISAASLYVNSTIPIGAEAQDSLLNYQANRMFGSDMDQLNPTQMNQLVGRYDSPWGMAHMISDKMDQSADSVGDFMSGAAEKIGGVFN